MSNNKSLPKVKVSAIFQPPILELAPISTGLIVVAVLDNHILQFARNVIENQAINCDSATGLPMPRVESFTSVYAGHARRLEQAKIQAAASPIGPDAIPHNFRSVGSRDGFNFLSDEGLDAILNILRETKGWLSIEQNGTSPDGDSIGYALLRLSTAAKQAGVRVVLFLAVKEGYQETRFHNYADEYVENGTSQPSPGVNLAISINCIGLKDLIQFGVGKTMCSISVSGAKFVYKFEPFVHAKLETRAMSWLRSQNRTFKEVGAEFGLDAANVFRRLQGLPTTAQLEDLPEDWLKIVKEHLALTSGNSKGSSQRKTPKNGRSSESTRPSKRRDCRR